MIVRKLKQQKGDTIVEVMLAMSVLSLVLFTSWAVTNRASQISLAARQRIEMVNQLKEQAEIVKAIYANDQSKIADKTFGGAVVRPTVAGTPAANPCDDSRSAVPSSAFYMSGAAAAVAGVKADGNGSSKVWMQIKDGGNGNSTFTDFYIRGCWLTTGGQQKEDNSQLIMRLNT